MSLAEVLEARPQAAAVVEHLEAHPGDRLAGLLVAGEIAWARVEQLEARAEGVEAELGRQVNERMKDRALATALLFSVRTLLNIEGQTNTCACGNCTARRSAIRKVVAQAVAAGLDLEDAKAKAARS